MRKKIVFGIIFILITFTVTSIAISGIDKKKKDDLFRQVELFSDVLTIVQMDYVEEVTPKNLIYGALKGMLSSLDPHSQFMDPDTYNELKVDTEGKFGGLGIEITIKDGLLTVISPIDDTPAWKAGIKANDRIVKINKELTRDIALTEAVKRMRGNPGEVVNLTILRESENRLIEFKIVRDIIKIKDLKDAKILEDGIGYVRLVEFRENTAQDLNNVLENLKKQGMTTFILDLRNDPGGILEVAAKVTEKFIEPGKVIVYTKGRKNAQNLEFVSNAKNPLTNIPMAVLINEGSASGSEIVAGCLQDYKRALIVGVKSFGKGSVQTVIPLSDGSALRLTTSRYFTPSGKQIHGKGVIPDIIVEEPKNESLDKKDKKIISGQNAFDEIEKKAEDKKGGFDYKNDFQLMRAIDALKVVKIYGIFSESKFNASTKQKEQVLPVEK